MLALTLHPTELRKPNHSVRAKLRASPAVGSGKLLLFYEVQGVDRIDWPKADPGTAPIIYEESFSGRRRDELWRATCFECFLGSVAQSDYIEWNFSITGDWAAYAFKSYRSEMVQASVSAPQFHLPQLHLPTKSERLFFEVETDLPEELRSSVADGLDFSRLEASLTAVIVEVGQEKPFYWAVEHRREKPDFHARESFTLIPRD
jgi:hypothetical protein